MSYKKALIIQTFLIPILTGTMTVISFFLVRFVSDTDAQAVVISNHESRISRLETVSEMLTRLADKYDVKIEKLDQKIEAKHGSDSRH